MFTVVSRVCAFCALQRRECIALFQLCLLLH